ncbi:MAG: DMT family transporter [Fimbriimonadaceae bacterium]|nr:DMT family transporter [Alphaproteobacteria bacterium]
MQDQAPGASRVGSYILIAYLLAALAMVFWSGNWVLGRAIRGEIPPLGLNFWRWTLATLILLPFTASRAKEDWPHVRDNWKVVVALGATGAAVFHSMIYIGLNSTEAINALLLNSVGPIIIILFAWLAFRDSITLRQVFGISISFIGTLILVSRGDFSVLSSLQLNVGDLWVLAALLIWGVYSNLLRYRPKNLGELSLLFYISVVGAILMIPAYIWEILSGTHMTFDVPTVISVIYTAVFASIFAFLCFNSSVARIGANTTSFFLHLMPVFGAVSAIIFLGETLHAYHFTGFAVVLSGIFLATSQRAQT